MRDLSSKIVQAAHYCATQGLCRQVALLLDFSRSSQLPRLRVVDLCREEVVWECLAATGRGRTLCERLCPRMSDRPESWLTPEGRSRVGERYVGEFGTAYRLDGLDATNANMRRRAIVLHSSEQVPDCAWAWLPLRCSRGCVVLSPQAFARVDALLADHTDVLLWIYR